MYGIPLTKIAVYALAFLGVMGAGAFAYHTLYAGPKLVAAQKQYDDLVLAYNKAIEEASAAAAKKTEDNKTAITEVTAKLKESQDALAIRSKNLRALAKIVRTLRAENASGATTADPLGTNSAATGGGSSTLVTTGGLLLSGAACYEQRTAGDVQGGGNSPVTEGAGDQETCRLTEQTSVALISIAEDGDSAIGQLNAVIDAYNKIQRNGCAPDSLNSGLTPQPSARAGLGLKLR